ncbi:N-acetylmuramoyl-L-alanine amidase [Nonomuraea sp. NPDC050328]|uniref:N-acetylmuramoyl-L-alanine amidase n=1 Tax=Nonomuraea sp. NPDC050328 TaxID=3364361 RepID=UPI0037AE3370
MSLSIVARSQWGARSPRPSGRYTVSWRERTEFFVHHTYGPTSQSLRSIQNFHMDGRKWGDIGYNFLVRDDGTLYEGRGWLTVGAHCPGHNRSGIAVAYIGDDKPTPAALRTIRALYVEACRRAGRTLRPLCHSDRFSTDCPGDRLRAWVRAGMPTTDDGAAGGSWTEDLVKDLPTLALDDRGYDVKTVRALLYARGHVPTSAYGSSAGLAEWLSGTDYDAGLAALVADFQETKRLEADGIVGPKTWPELLRL